MRYFIAWYLNHDRERTNPIRHRYATTTIEEGVSEGHRLMAKNLDIQTWWIYGEDDINYYTYERGEGYQG